MATLTQVSTVPESSATFRADWSSCSRFPSRVYRESYTGYSWFDRTTACSSETLLNRRFQEGACSSTWLLASGPHVDSKTPVWFVGRVKSEVYSRIPGGKRSGGMLINCAHGPSSGGNDSIGGDPRVQQMLVEMVKIQVGKARMTEFVDERSQHLRNIAEEAHLEYDRIANRTMKGLDATGSRVLRQLDADANAIEKDLRIAHAELEAQSRDFEEFQIRLAYSRNEGLFFKNLYQAPWPISYRSTSSTNKLKEKVAVVTPTSGRDFSSSYRQLLYGGLSLVIVSFIWSSSSAFLAGTCMRASKLASYGIIISLLLTQLAYVKVITGEADTVVEQDDQSR